MRKRTRLLLWSAPLMLHSLDAQAWGLVTHVYFAQWLVWALPFADPDLRRAVMRFPQLVMAGACLPDLALLSATFRGTHQWHQVHQLAENACNEQQAAIAIGYASHLLADVMAHNHFVPAHEAMWMKDTLLTHITSEWAVDAHLAPLTEHAPHRLLTENRQELAAFISAHFGCDRRQAVTAMQRLAHADRWLRGIRVPQALYCTFKQLDTRIFRHFVYYISQTQHLLQDIESVLTGTVPIWEPDPRHGEEVTELLRQQSLHQLQERHHQPISLLQPFTPVFTGYSSRNESLAMQKPMAAPASTSLG